MIEILTNVLTIAALIFVVVAPSVPMMIYVAGHQKRMEELEENLRLRRKEYQKRKVESEKFIAESKKRTAELQQHLAELRRHRNRTLGGHPTNKGESE
ncbi:MAG: hypothetical protein JJ891_16730 [Rhizobiaceae bacterium]|nr:hypothetical protein [Rhizobiaceae bacterium]